MENEINETPKKATKKKKIVEIKEETVTEIPKIDTNINKIEIKVTETKEDTLKIYDILNSYIKNYTQFKLYYKNELIFDSMKTLRKNFPKFTKTEFIVGGIKYIYKGIRIETY